MIDRSHSDSFTLEAVRVLVLVGLALALLRAAGSVVTVLLFGAFLASIAYPTYRGMIRRGWPGWLALLLVMAGFVLFLGVIGLILYEALARMSVQIPQHADGFHEHFSGLLTLLEQYGLKGSVTDRLHSIDSSRIAGMALTMLAGVGDIIDVFMFSLLWVLFLLPSLDGLRAIIVRHSDSHPVVANIPLVADASIGYFRLRLRLSLVLGVALTVVYFAVGVPNPLLWGVLAIFLTFIPYVGLIFAVAPPAVLVFGMYGLSSVIVLIILVVVVDLIVDYVLQSFWAQETFQISAAVSLFSVVLWAYIFGFVGSILAVPITVVIASALRLDPQTRWLSDILVGVPITEPDDTPPTEPQVMVADPIPPG